MRDALMPSMLSLPYPQSSPAQRKLTKAIEAIDSLRSALDGQAARDLANDFDTRLYYPGDQSRARPIEDCDPKDEYHRGAAGIPERLPQQLRAFEAERKLLINQTDAIF
jgi:hypothetical protein